MFQGGEALDCERQPPPKAEPTSLYRLAGKGIRGPG